MAMRMRTGFMILTVSVVLAGVLEPAAAQDRPVRFGGRVQWIAGQVMAVQLDNGHSVSVDLLRVRQDEYAVLIRGERIVVIGVVTDRSRYVIGTSVVRGGYAQAP